MVWAPEYVTTLDLADYLRITDTVDDAQLTLAVSAASRAVDLHTNRQFGQTTLAEERFYLAHWDRRRRRWIVELDDVQDLTGFTVTVSVGGVETPITEFTLEPLNAPQKGKPFTSLIVDVGSTVNPSQMDESRVTVMALWGWLAVPTAIEQATLLQASRLFARRTSPYGVAGSPEMGNELRLLERLDPDVAVTLSPFIRWWAAA